MYTHFVWLFNMRGGFEPQLWSRDFSSEKMGGGATSHRADMPHIVGERLAKKYALPPEDADITLDAAMAKYPEPNNSHAR